MVNVATITTGDELGGMGASVATDTLLLGNPHSNAQRPPQPLSRLAPYRRPPTMLQRPGRPDRLREILADADQRAHIVLLTGGRFDGEPRLLPQIVTQLGAKTVFHNSHSPPANRFLVPSNQHTPGSSAKTILDSPVDPVVPRMGALR